ncbi:MAG: tRNA pseudouridine(55) synthase TruB [Chloroflexi bacterium]|nr:tRNA pseudouridine(55) synthase TruB [Chloroflexota bacterium]
MSSPSGVLAADKPLGWTSHDVVAVIRGASGIRRVGHGGTLDPLATGVLPILVGPATKFVDRLHGASKVYAALVRFGSETTTEDREGAVAREAPVPAGVGDEDLRAFRGTIQQVPSGYSAIKVDGRRAYDRARGGETLALEARTITIERLAIAGWSAPDLRLLIVCSTGTYIRALARDLGRALGSAAHLAGLRRLAVGALDAEGAAEVEALRRGGPAAVLSALREPDDRLLVLPERYRSDAAAALLAGWAP